MNPHSFQRKQIFMSVFSGIDALVNDSLIGMSKCPCPVLYLLDWLIFILFQALTWGAYVTGLLSSLFAYLYLRCQEICSWVLLRIPDWRFSHVTFIQHQWPVYSTSSTILFPHRIFLLSVISSLCSETWAAIWLSYSFNDVFYYWGRCIYDVRSSHRHSFHPVDSAVFQFRWVGWRSTSPWNQSAWTFRGMLT